MITWPNKDPDEVLNYGFLWARELGDDVIASSMWIVPAGLTKSGEGHTDNATVVKLSGGTEGETYEITNRITTTDTTETIDQSARFKVKSR